MEARTITVNENDAQEKVRYLSLWDRKVLLVPASLEVNAMPVNTIEPNSAKKRSYGFDFFDAKLRCALLCYLRHVF